jgi:hypothetical protein
VGQTRTYELRVRVANAGTGAKFRIEVDGNAVTGSVPVPNTGGWDNWADVVLNVPLTQGQHVVRLVLTTANSQNSGVGNYGYFQFN